MWRCSRIVGSPLTQHPNNDCGRAADGESDRTQCRKFVGQGGTKDKKSKMTQKEQKAVLQAFRDLKVNTLVATCIGEEGLDIPEVDLVVCLDVSSSPTRGVQRTGRMGRHRAGSVVHILAKGGEERKFTQAEAVRLESVAPAVSSAACM